MTFSFIVPALMLTFCLPLHPAEYGTTLLAVALLKSVLPRR